MMQETAVGAHRVILFDGVCNFCSGSVDWIIRHDRRRRFRFAPLQSAAGERLQREHGLEPDALDTLVIVEGDSAYVRSTAALKIVRELGFPWSLLYGFILVPRPVRDFVYNVFARRRYGWFGKRDECMVPAPEVRERFLVD